MNTITRLVRPAVSLSLFLSPIAALAGWDLISEGDLENGVVSYYLNCSTVEKTQDGYRAWTMTDQTAPDPVYGRSSKALVEVDCINKRKRLLQLNLYSGPKGSGTPLGSDEPDDAAALKWRFVTPGTTGETMFRAICEYATRKPSSVAKYLTGKGFDFGLAPGDPRLESLKRLREQQAQRRDAEAKEYYQGDGKYGCKPERYTDVPD